MSEHTTSAPSVAQRSDRRATAQRASRRRATSRRYTPDLEALVIDFLEHHPHSTTGDVAKAINAHRAEVGAAVEHMLNTNEVAKTEHGYSVPEREAEAPL